MFRQPRSLLLKSNRSWISHGQYPSPYKLLFSCQQRNGISDSCTYTCTRSEISAANKIYTSLAHTMFASWRGTGKTSALLRGGADNSLARPGRKQATATKLAVYSTHSPRSSIHFLARCSNFCKPLKKSEGFPSNQVSAAAMTFAWEEKWPPCNCFFSPGNRW